MERDVLKRHLILLLLCSSSFSLRILCLEQYRCFWVEGKGELLVGGKFEAQIKKISVWNEILEIEWNFFSWW